MMRTCLNSSIFDIQYSGVAEYDTDHCLVISRLGTDCQCVNKRKTHKFVMGKCNLTKIKDSKILD